MQLLAITWICSCVVMLLVYFIMATAGPISIFNNCKLYFLACVTRSNVQTVAGAITMSGACEYFLLNFPYSFFFSSSFFSFSSLTNAVCFYDMAAIRWLSITIWNKEPNDRNNNNFFIKPIFGILFVHFISVGCHCHCHYHCKAGIPLLSVWWNLLALKDTGKSVCLRILRWLCAWHSTNNSPAGWRHTI